MIPLICTVRGCGLPLALSTAALRCDSGHAFDRAREGYWNLIQAQDRRSARPGDAASAATARRRWLDRGFVEPLAEMLSSGVDALGLEAGALAVDVGCGEGTLTARLLRNRDLRICGIDLSVPAVRLAARLLPEATWVVANADRGIPLEGASAALALSVFGRRPVQELGRVVRAGGHALVVVPGENDLLELRAEIQGRGARRDRAGGVLHEMATHFRAVERHTWSARAFHDRDALADAAAMSYRGARRAERTRLEGIDSLEVTLAAEMILLRRAG